MKFFKIIIPNYNNAKWLPKCVNSVLNQTFKNFHVVIIDDVSTDNSKEVINELTKNKNVSSVLLNEKRWSGGTRNVGLEFYMPSEYTMFIDSDDWLEDENCLQDIYDLIQKNNNPDCIRLSYNYVKGENITPVILSETTVDELVDNVNVACWLKVVKSNLVPKFLENTLFEDAIFNIVQCDNIESVVPIKRPIINWNRNNENSTSTHITLQNGKWISSQYRYVADLMDMKCKHSYCERERQLRLNSCINHIKNGRVSQDK